MDVRTPILWCLVMALGGCGTEDTFEAPSPPDISQTLAQYETPTARLTPKTGQQLAEAVLASLENAQRLGRLLVYVSALVPRFSEALEQGLTSTDASGLAEAAAVGPVQQRQSALVTSLTLHGQLEHDCDRGEGLLDLNAILEEAALLPDFWGEASGCLIANEDGPADIFDGSVRVRLGWLDGDGATTIIFSGTVEREGVTDPLNFDLQFYEDDRFAMSELVDGGSMVAVLKGGQAGLEFQVLDAGGIWTCGVLESALGIECEGPDGERVSW